MAKRKVDPPKLDPEYIDRVAVKGPDGKPLKFGNPKPWPVEDVEIAQEPADSHVSVPRAGARARGGRPRVVTMEVAEAFAAAIKGDVTHSVTSAAHAVGVHPKTLLDCLNRYERGESESAEDEEIGAVLSAARAEHIKELRGKGELAAGDANGPGVAWVKWRLETQAPKEHGRVQNVELTGKDGAPIAVAAARPTRAQAIEAMAAMLGMTAEEVARRLGEGESVAGMLGPGEQEGE